MVEGRLEKIKWSRYESPNLNLSWTPMMEQDCYHFGNKSPSCATTAIKLITLKSKRVIEKHCINKDSMSTTRIIYILKKFGYDVKVVSKSNITYCAWYQMPLNQNHLLVINARVDSEENSCYVIHKSKVWHNGSGSDINPLFFLNKPTQDVLLISHKKWSY